MSRTDEDRTERTVQGIALLVIGYLLGLRICKMRRERPGVLPPPGDDVLVLPDNGLYPRDGERIGRISSPIPWW